jgi:dTDP-4-amino-4,6-dideoxygalactose transaminase
VSESVASEVLSLPMFPELTAAQVETVASALISTQAGTEQAVAQP